MNKWIVAILILAFSNVCDALDHSGPKSMGEAGKQRKKDESPDVGYRLITLVAKLENGKLNVERTWDNVPLDKNGKPKLEPKRLYHRWDEGVKLWVYDITDSGGAFSTDPPLALLTGSVIPSEWTGGKKGHAWKFTDQGKKLDVWVLEPQTKEGFYSFLELVEPGGKFKFFWPTEKIKTTLD